MFFLTFLPQFLPPHGPVLAKALTYCGVFAALYLTWFSLYVFTVDRIGTVLRPPRSAPESNTAPASYCSVSASASPFKEFRDGDLLTNWIDVTERKMFGGLTFMIGGHMCCGVNGNELIRLDPEREDEALGRPHARPMDFAGRPLRGFITVRSEGLKGSPLSPCVQEAVARAESLPPK